MQAFACREIPLEGNSSGEPSNIWIDHSTLFASLSKCAGDASCDGGIDMKKCAHHVTGSYNDVPDYQKVALNGYSDNDTKNAAARTTYRHDRFENVESRLPLQRRGLSHSYNNDFNNVLTSGINARMGAVALIEANCFENAKNPVIARDSSEIGYWDLINNYLGNGITWSVPDSDSKPCATPTAGSRRRPSRSRLPTGTPQSRPRRSRPRSSPWRAQAPTWPNKRSNRHAAAPVRSGTLPLAVLPHARHACAAHGACTEPGRIGGSAHVRLRSECESQCDAGA